MTQGKGGIPRWLLWAIAGKIALIVLIVAAVLWWMNR
jgi:hypothetical protein